MDARGWYPPAAEKTLLHRTEMKRPLILCTAIAGLGACATSLPPAPTVLPMSASVPDSLIPPIQVLPVDTLSAAGAEVLNELASASPDAAAVPAFDASRVRWDIDVQTYADHPRVRYYLSYFQGPARQGMAAFLSRGARYEPLIRQRFEAVGLPGDLGYLALIESGYSNEAVSRAYAVGMWQFMRGTGRGYGLRVDSWVDERRDPLKATAAAARHLADLRGRFGSLYLAAAAYNAGAGKVSRSLGKLEWELPAESAADSTAGLEDEDAAAEAGDAAFFRLASNDLLAAETQDYVPKLIAAALIAKEPERYGFTPNPSVPFVYDSLIVTEATGLDVIARLGDTSLATIQELNPQYLRLATPPRSTTIIRLPPGSGAQVAERYAALPRSERVHYLTHVVRRREKLGAIAARYHLPASEIRTANPGFRGTRPAAGTRLVIPAVAVPSALAMRAVSARAPHRSHHAVHRVRRGETLSGIALRYRVSVKALRRVNAIRSDYALRAGMRLRIPG
jgi:membrane-bound lytic murein transglycosylase D